MLDNLNHYNVFYTVAKTGSISKAAAKLFISQPAVSKAISSLEENVGVTLFYRESRGVSLTEEGAVLFDHIEKAMENISRGEENLKKYTENGVGHIRIGVSTSLCKYILLDYLKDFIKENPHIKVSIDCHSTLNTIKLLKNEEIDIGLICETDLTKDIVYKPVQEIHDIFVAGSDYVDNLIWARENASENGASANTTANLILGNMASLLNDDSAITSKPIKPARLKEILESSNLMVLEEANVSRTHVDNYLAQNDIHPTQLLEINNMDLLVEFASIGMGVAAVVREFAKPALESGQIIELPVKKPIAKRTVGFAYNANGNKSVALGRFMEYLGV